jgi:hypothetical protein
MQGKSLCTGCGGFFSSQGIAKHKSTCDGAMSGINFGGLFSLLAYAIKLFVLFQGFMWAGSFYDKYQINGNSTFSVRPPPPDIDSEFATLAGLTKCLLSHKGDWIEHCYGFIPSALYHTNRAGYLKVVRQTSGDAYKSQSGINAQP